MADTSKCQLSMTVPRPREPAPHRRRLRKVASESPLSERVGTLRRRSSLLVPERPRSMMGGRRSLNVKRWDGKARLTSSWDALRRDPDLWTSDGDCLVHLSSRGHSRRGPSFRLPFALVQEAWCSPLLELYSTQSPPASPSSQASSSSDNDYFGAPLHPASCQLYVPAPPEMTGDEAYLYHLGTRNFFAWLLGKPLVGEHLGPAMVELLDRMKRFRSEDCENVEDILHYFDRQGYADFRECPDLALSMLYFAEHHRLRDRWIDAFAHCAGMDERLSCSAELPPISRISKALITRARLEMDIRVERCTLQLKNFLDDDLSETYLGLGNGARAHLDRFRSFLQSYYVGKLGFWPPVYQNGTRAYPRYVYTMMYGEFRNLYEYLQDRESTASLADNLRPASGGLCVLQNVVAFDKRQGHVSLPHPMPLLPGEIPLPVRRTLTTMSLGRSFSKAVKLDKKAYTLAALYAATNAGNVSVMSCPMIRAYQAFERESTIRTEEKVSPSDARKVRWLLIYAIFQTLVCVTRAPAEVRHTDGIIYNLCCQTTGTPPWEHDASWLSRQASKRSDEAGSSRVEIRPDTDYQLAYKSSLSRKASVKQAQARPNSFHEILIPGYGNGWMDVEVSSKSSDGPESRWGGQGGSGSGSGSVSTEASRSKSNSTRSTVVSSEGEESNLSGSSSSLTSLLEQSFGLGKHEAEGLREGERDPRDLRVPGGARGGEKLGSATTASRRLLV